MNEDYILDLLVYSALNRGSNLTHHGIPHQKWGERNGPPYPLSRSQKSAAEKKAEDQNNGHTKTELKVPSRTSKKTSSPKKQVKSSDEILKDLRGVLDEDTVKELSKESPEAIAAVKEWRDKLVIETAYGELKDLYSFQGNEDLYWKAEEKYQSSCEDEENKWFDMCDSLLNMDEDPIMMDTLSTRRDDLNRDVAERLLDLDSEIKNSTSLKVDQKKAIDDYFDCNAKEMQYAWLNEPSSVDRELEDYPNSSRDCKAYISDVREFYLDRIDRLQKSTGKTDKELEAMATQEQQNSTTKHGFMNSDVYKYAEKTGHVLRDKKFNKAVQLVNNMFERMNLNNDKSPYKLNEGTQFLCEAKCNVLGKEYGWIATKIFEGDIDPNDTIYKVYEGYGIKGQSWGNPAELRKRSKEPKQQKELYNPETGKVNKLEYMKRVFGSNSFDKNLDTYNQLQEAKTIRKQKKEAAKSEKQTRKRDLAIKSMSNRGLTQEEIAKRLGISPSTVSNVLL